LVSISICEGKKFYGAVNVRDDQGGIGEKLVFGIIRRSVVDVVIFGGRNKCVVFGIFGWRFFDSRKDAGIDVVGGRNLNDIYVFDGENFDGVVNDRDIGVRKFLINGKYDAEIIRRGAGILFRIFGGRSCYGRLGKVN